VFLIFGRRIETNVFLEKKQAKICGRRIEQKCVLGFLCCELLWKNNRQQPVKFQEKEQNFYSVMAFGYSSVMGLYFKKRSKISILL
jgi:hypothetical protein